MTTNEDNQKPINPKREALINLSSQAFEFREAQINMAQNAYEAAFWESKTLNYIMLNHLYETDEANEFHTFHQWKQKGATVIKGAKAFAIWGQPIRAEKSTAKPETEKDTAEDYKYFPMCFLFSDKQVVLPVISERPAEPKQQLEPVNLDGII